MKLFENFLQKHRESHFGRLYSNIRNTCQIQLLIAYENLEEDLLHHFKLFLV